MKKVFSGGRLHWYKMVQGTFREPVRTETWAVLDKEGA